VNLKNLSLKMASPNSIKLGRVVLFGKELQKLFKELDSMQNLVAIRLP
jgi:hypothetical protein